MGGDKYVQYVIGKSHRPIVLRVMALITHSSAGFISHLSIVHKLFFRLYDSDLLWSHAIFGFMTFNCK